MNKNLLKIYRGGEIFCAIEHWLIAETCYSGDKIQISLQNNGFIDLWAKSFSESNDDFNTLGEWIRDGSNKNFPYYDLRFCCEGAIFHDITKGRQGFHVYPRKDELTHTVCGDPLCEGACEKQACWSAKEERKTFAAMDPVKVQRVDVDSASSMDAFERYAKNHCSFCECTDPTCEVDHSVEHSAAGSNFATLVADDEINPAHYKKGGIEVFDYFTAKANNVFEEIGGCRINVYRYTGRPGEKDINKYAVDLKKARWYLDKWIKIVEDNLELIIKMQEMFK